MLDKIPGLEITTIDGLTLATMAGPDGSRLTCQFWEDRTSSGDPFRYMFPCPPNDKTGAGPFSHPTRYGCEIAIHRFFVDCGAIVVPEGNEHLDATDKGILSGIVAAFKAIAPARPRVGDYVEIEGRGPHRVCALHEHGAQTTAGGRFYIGGDGRADYSGGLDCSKLYERFVLTDDRKPGRFWFFHHGRAGAGRGVDCNIPCRVFRLIGLEWTEEKARNHPSIKRMAEFWGADHAEVERAVARLMANPT